MADQPRILMFHKPKGCVVTRDDERGRKTVYDLLPAFVQAEGFIPVGRLDMDTRGLLLFVQDGKLMDALSRPGAHEKTYEAWVRGRVTPEHAAFMLRGVDSPVGTLAAVKVALKGGAGPKSRVEVVLDEGRNRHIRRMFGALTDPERSTPLKVLELKRVAFGPLRLDIESGKWRWLSDDEVRSIGM